MLKDLKLAQQAAQTSGASTPMGAEAAQLFNLFVNAGNGAKDFSGIIQHAGRQVRPHDHALRPRLPGRSPAEPVLLARQVRAEAQGPRLARRALGFTEKQKIAFAQSQTVSGHP